MIFQLRSQSFASKSRVIYKTFLRYLFENELLFLLDHEIKEYYKPEDLRIGKSLVIYGRAFLLYDCDSFTKAWYYQNFGLTDFKSIPIEQKGHEIKELVGYCPEIAVTIQNFFVLYIVTFYFRGMTNVTYLNPQKVTWTLLNLPTKCRTQLI